MGLTYLGVALMLNRQVLKGSGQHTQRFALQRVF